MRYHRCRGPRVTDVLIRDVPEDVVSAIEAKAKRLGLSRISTSVTRGPCIGGIA